MNNKSKFEQLSNFFSQNRLNRYLVSVNHNEVKAIEIYFLNIKLCSLVYPWLCFLEVGLRNAIDRYYEERFNDDEWLKNSVNANGFLNTPKCFESKIKIEAEISNLLSANKLSKGKLIASLSFGVWRNLFNNQQFKYGGYSLHNCLKNYAKPEYKGPDPFGSEKIAQKQIYKWLTNINTFRNRVAHYEPICFDKKLESVDTHYIEATLNLIEKILYFLDIDLTLLENFDNPREV
ncbi:MAG: Abi family protein, partial [Flexibacteraceae bacterium]